MKLHSAAGCIGNARERPELVADYFQFPLCLLAYAKHEKERLSAIIDYNVVEYAINKLGSKNRKSITTAAEVLGVSYGNVSSAVPNWQEAHDYVERFQFRHGTDALVRIGAALLWDCRKSALSYRELSILCALNSILGASKCPKRVTQPSIRVRAAGYKSWAVFKANVPEERWPEILLSDDKVYRSLDKMEERGLFVRARVGPRVVLFMAGVSYDELCAKILELEKKKSARRGRAEKDRRLRERIKAISADLNRGADLNSEVLLQTGTEKAQKKREQECAENADPSADQRADGSADLNDSSLMKASNESISNESVSNGTTSSFLGEKKEAVLEENGYLLREKFFPADEANRLASDNQELIFKFQKARRRNGKVVLQRCDP